MCQICFDSELYSDFVCLGISKVYSAVKYDCYYLLNVNAYS